MKATRLAVLSTIAVTLLTLAALAANDQQTYTGWVMDQNCAAKGAKADVECAKKCIQGGSPMVLVNDADKNLLTVANPKALEDHIGHHVKVQGTVANNKLTVMSAEMAPEKGGQ